MIIATIIWDWNGTLLDMVDQWADQFQDTAGVLLDSINELLTYHPEYQDIIV